MTRAACRALSPRPDDSPRRARRPQVPRFGNLGPRWTFDWLSYVEEVPYGCFTNGGYTEPQCYPYVWIYHSGGWRDFHSGANGQGVFPVHPRTQTVLVRTSTNPVRYERRLPDGRVDVYGQSDGGPLGAQRVFLTERRDARGQSLQFTYDIQSRLVAATDALGQVTTLAYEHPTDSLKITAVEDPFGRRATFTYHATGQLASITDTLGLTSSCAYGCGDLIQQMTTPYGTTTFRHEAQVDSYSLRYIEATDPSGATERLTFALESAEIPTADAAADVPTGFEAWNSNLRYSNTLDWDKRAWQAGPGSVATATITKWMWAVASRGLASTAVPVPHSIKRPLERRVWYAYPGQVATTQGAKYLAAIWKPSRIGRVVDGGSSQISETTYNALGEVLTEMDRLGGVRSGPMPRTASISLRCATPRGHATICSSPSAVTPRNTCRKPSSTRPAKPRRSPTTPLGSR